MNEIEAGDLVQLKSGGPAMTVVSPGVDAAYHPTCAWFDESKVCHEMTFPRTLLRKCAPLEPKPDPEVDQVAHYLIRALYERLCELEPEELLALRGWMKLRLGTDDDDMARIGIAALDAFEEQ